MEQRPELHKGLDAQVFKEFYYLKTELIAFCRDVGLPTSGGKMDITNGIAYYLETGKVLSSTTSKKLVSNVDELYLDTRIEKDILCSQKHRAFFKTHIGKRFTFHVAFQTWLKQHAGKTYQEAIKAYYQLEEIKKKTKTTIDEQFAYNTYIRDFFEENKGYSLSQAIKCWKYKKQRQGHHRYEINDLIALDLDV